MKGIYYKINSVPFTVMWEWWIDYNRVLNIW